MSALKSVFLSLSDKHHPEISEPAEQCGTRLLTTRTHTIVHPSASALPLGSPGLLKPKVTQIRDQLFSNVLDSPLCDKNPNIPEYLQQIFP